MSDNEKEDEFGGESGGQLDRTGILLTNLSMNLFCDRLRQ